MGGLGVTIPRKVLISSDMRSSLNFSRWSKSSATNRFSCTLGFYTHISVESCRKLAGPEKLCFWAMISVWYRLWGIICRVIFWVTRSAKKNKISSFALICSGNDLGWHGFLSPFIQKKTKGRCAAIRIELDDYFWSAHAWRLLYQLWTPYRKTFH